MKKAVVVPVRIDFFILGHTQKLPYIAIFNTDDRRGSEANIVENGLVFLSRALMPNSYLPGIFEL